MKKLITLVPFFLLIVCNAAFAASTFDDVIIENTLTLSAESASTVPYLDGSKKITSSSVTPTELGFLSGVTSSVQTQLNGKQAAGSYEPAISAGTTGQYWRGDKSFQTLDTLAVPENTNLYYTAARFNTAFSAKSTTDLSEGSNLYYTDARTRASVSATAPLAYVSGTGVFSMPVATGSANGYLSLSDWTTFNNKEPAITSGTTSQYWRGDKSFQTLDKTAVGLANVDNTSDANKPVSTATQTALNLKADLASPALTGVPTAPTAASGTNTTQIATTAFVTDATSQPAPSASSTSLVTTTAASTTFVTALTTSITVTAASAPVMALCILDMTSATSASVATVRVTINAVAGGSVTESLTTATTQHLTVPNQYLSTSLAAGTYTVNCDFNRASGTGTVTIAQGSLRSVAIQGSRPATGVVPLAGGGTNNATLTAANGAVIYSTATALDKTAVGSAGQVLQSNGAAAPTWTAQTYPASTTINQLMYSSANNVVAGLATANTGALVTSSTGVPSITSGATANRLLRTNGTTVSFAQAALTTDVTGTLPVANGGTGLSAAFAAGRVMFSNGSTNAADSLFTYDATNNRLTIGNGGTSRLSAVVQTTDTQPNDIALNVYSRATAQTAMSLQNENTLATLDMTNSGGTAVGANILAEASRGTLASRTQSQSTDTLFSLTAHGRTASGWSTGYGATLSAVATENVTNTTNGAEWILATTANGGTTPVERLRIKQSGETQLTNSHLKSTQTTAPTATVNANAGTGATCSVANSTDMAGQISITTGTIGLSTGAYCDVNFNTAYGVAPICVLTPAGSALSTSVYVTSTTAKATVNFAVAGGISTTYLLNYHCMETQ